MSNKLLVPDIGDFDSVEIVEILIKPGDKINKNDSIVTLESDKSSVEVPSTETGVIESVDVKIGDKVSKGDLLVTLKNLEEKKEEVKKKSQENIPTDTEKIIKEAETVLAVEEKKDNSKSKINESKIELKSGEDVDPTETKEWIDSLSAVLENDGKHRAQFLIKQLIEHSYKEGSE